MSIAVNHERRQAQREMTMGRAFPIEKVRNIGIIAHIDAGKTTVTEHVLYHTGRTYKLGGVDEGTTVMDWMQHARTPAWVITCRASRSPPSSLPLYPARAPGHVDF